ncbi:Flagellar hook-associated protein 3 [compost metagenome]
MRASVGARLNEMDVLDVVGSNRMLNYEQILSERLDLDYNKAISDYTLRQVGLQAAQKTFVDVQKLSLFNQL